MPTISGVLAIRGLDVLFEHAFGPESACAPELTGIFDSSLRPFVKNPG